MGKQGFEMGNRLRVFLQDESGATAIEYAMMAMLIGLSGVVGFRAAGGNLEQLYAVIQTAIAKLNT